jgi:hypothetical protein
MGVVCGGYKIKKGSFLNLKISWKIYGQHHLPPLRQNTPRGKGGDVGVPEGIPPLGERYCIYYCTQSTPSPYGLYIWIKNFSYYKYKDKILQCQILGNKKRDKFFRFTDHTVTMIILSLLM